MRPLLLLALSALVAAAAQPARTVPVGDPLYDAVERLQRRGLLLELHPTALPYTEAEVRRALATVDSARVSPRAAEWLGLVRRQLTAAAPGPDRLGIRADLGVEPVASTSARLDALRPLRGTADAPSFRVGEGGFWTQADATVAVGTGAVVAQLGVFHSLYANDDPDGFDVVNRAMMRNQEAYVAYRGELADIALGSIGTHWGLAGHDALVVSDNPWPFDALHLRVGTPRVSVRSVVGQLDSARPDGTFRDEIGERPGDRPNGEPRVDRYLAAHRFDWRPSRKVALTVLESAIYSGENADLSLGYLLPTQVFTFFVDNTPKNTENNGFVAGMLWAQWRAWTLSGQVLIDDFDVVSGIEPASAAITGALVRADAVPGLDLELEGTAVTARAYNAPQREGIYTFALRGLATEFSDYVRLGLGADWYAARGLTVSPRVQALWQGERSIESPYPRNDEAGAILTGDVTRTLRLGLDLAYQSDPRWWARADLGVNASGDPFADGFHATVAVGARLNAAGAVRAGL